MRPVIRRLRSFAFSRLEASYSSPNLTDVRTIRISTLVVLEKELAEQHGTFLHHYGTLRTLSYISWPKQNRKIGIQIATVVILSPGTDIHPSGLAAS